MAKDNNLPIHRVEKGGEKSAGKPLEIAIEKVEKVAPRVEKETIQESLPEHIAKEAAAEDLEDKGGEREVARTIPKDIISQPDQKRIKEIENVLSEGLEDIYLKMNPDKQLEFKRMGEQTARKINELIERGKAKVKKVIILIKKWLALIPGVNKFFLEQEAKIKADEIMKASR